MYYPIPTTASSIGCDPWAAPDDDDSCDYDDPWAEDRCDEDRIADIFGD